MGRRTYRKSKNKLFNQLWRSSLSLFKVILGLLKEFIQRALVEILFEICILVQPLVYVYLLTSWGIPLSIALIMAIIATIASLIMITALLTIVGSVINKLDKSPESTKLKAEVRLARRIAEVLANRSASEWTEYQDWLHDILLKRRQLLDARHPRWRVSLITYWRLSVFCTVVAASKIKQVTFILLRLR